MRSWVSASEEETLAVGAALAEELRPDGTLLLSGELGSGKTVLARGVAGALGVPPRAVVSPTFTLIAEHQGEGGRFVHVDLYRLEPGELSRLGLEELLAGEGVKVVEWAERLPFEVRGAISLELSRQPGGGRRIEEVAVPASPRQAAPRNPFQRDQRREDLP